MLIKKVDVALVQTALIAGNYKELLSGLRRIGRPIKHTWLKSLPSNASSGEKYKFTSNSRFKNFLVTELKDSEIIQPSAASQDIDHLKNTLSQLALFLMVWKDDLNLSSESEESVNNLSEAEKKRLRQRIKYKSSLDKDDRYAINIALQTIAYILCQQVDRLFPEQETSNTNNKTFVVPLKGSHT